MARYRNLKPNLQNSVYTNILPTPYKLNTVLVCSSNVHLGNVYGILEADVVEVLQAAEDEVSRAEKNKLLSTIVERIYSTDGDSLMIHFIPFTSDGSTLVLETSATGVRIASIESAPPET